MNRVCPKCAYRREPGDLAPEYECPRCGVVYEKYRVTTDPPESDANGPTAVPGLRLVPPPTDETPQAETSALPTPWLRYGALAAASLLLLVIIAVSVNQHRNQASNEPGNGKFAGVYEGSTTRAIALSNGRTYQAEYQARFEIDEDARISELTWTDSSNLLDRATVSWSAPARVEYTIVVREDYTRDFEDPPDGEYSRFVRDGASFRLEAIHPHSADLRRFEYAGEVPPRVSAKEAVIDGVLHPSKTERGTAEAVIHPGLPKIGRVEAALDSVVCELAESAANRVLETLLRKGGASPDTNLAGTEEPGNRVTLERVMVPRWPGRLWIDFHNVRVRAASRTYDSRRRQMVESLPRAELDEDSRIVLDFFDPIGWKAGVLFLADGRAVVRVPARNIEIPMTKLEGLAVAHE
jgi:hypothetical protein